MNFPTDHIERIKEFGYTESLSGMERGDDHGA